MTRTARRVLAAEPTTPRVTAKATPAKAAAPAKAAKVAAPPAFDVAALAANVQPVNALPKMRRTSAASPFVALVKRSYDEQIALAAPAVPAEAVKSLHTAIRRAATVLGVGVSIRDEQTEQGVVVTFQAKERAERKSE